MLKDSHRQLEDVEKTRAREAMRQTEVITTLKKEVNTFICTVFVSEEWSRKLPKFLKLLGLIN